MNPNELLDPPRRLRPSDIAQRYDITERMAGEWIRRMKAAGVIATIGITSVGRLSACDAWVASGGADTRKTRKRSMRGVVTNSADAGAEPSPPGQLASPAILHRRGGQ